MRYLRLDASKIYAKGVGDKCDVLFGLACYVAID